MTGGAGEPPDDASGETSVDLPGARHAPADTVRAVPPGGRHAPADSVRAMPSGGLRQTIRGTGASGGPSTPTRGTASAPPVLASDASANPGAWRAMDTRTIDALAAADSLGGSGALAAADPSAASCSLATGALGGSGAPDASCSLATGAPAAADPPAASDSLAAVTAPLLPAATACPDENQLMLLAEDALGPDERRALERHLDGCFACARLVGELAQLAAPARPAPPRYRIVRQLGAGAMGVVWEAEDTHLARHVALKFVTPEGVADRAPRARLFREARALAQLRHPNVVAVHDAGEVGDELFVALELVPGSDARSWLAAAPRALADIVGVWRQAAAGLAAVHRAGIIHRDIKPDNVLVAADGRVLVGDFGLATGELGGHAAPALTTTGTVVGTPMYMAPEQLRGEPATAASDQYALCTSLWEAITGARPYTGATYGALVHAMTARPALPPAPRATRRVLAVLARGLDPDPGARWPDVGALERALGGPARGGRRAVWLAVGAALAAAAITAIALSVMR